MRHAPAKREFFPCDAEENAGIVELCRGFLTKSHEKKGVLMEWRISQWFRKRMWQFGNSISSNRYGWDAVDR